MAYIVEDVQVVNSGGGPTGVGTVCRAIVLGNRIHGEVGDTSMPISSSNAMG